MSEVDPQKRKQDKANTDNWKLKQEEKKKKKALESQAGQQPTQNINKKEKKEKQNQHTKPTKNQQKKEEVKQEQPEPKKALAAEQVVLQSNKKASTPSIVYHKLTNLDMLLTTKDKQSRVYQQELIAKYLDQCVSKNDVILYVGNKTNNLSCQQVYAQGINCNTNAELVCRYSDLSYFFEGTVTKVFIEAEYIFGNGSILAKEGALNIALMAKRYNLPVLAIGGSWLYNGWSAVNYEALEERYGSEALQKLDWIEQKYIKSLVMQVGISNPRQVSIYPGIIYKNVRLTEISW